MISSNLKFVASSIIIILTVVLGCDSVTIYDQKNHRGDNITLKLDHGKCMNLPKNWEHRASSINTHGLCLNIFGERNCKGDKYIQIYPNTRYHHDLSLWDFDDALVSLNVCSHKFSNKDHATQGHTIWLYADKDKRGRKLVFSLWGCKNLPKLWYGNVTGAETFARCYKFYDKENCTGNNLEVSQFIFNKYNLEDHDFNDKTVSIGECEKKENRPEAMTKDDNNNNNNKLNIYLLCGFLAVFAAIIIVGGVAIGLNFRSKKMFKEKLLQIEIINQTYIYEFLRGNPKAYDKISYENADGIYRARNMAYDYETYEVPFECLQIEPFDVAVKTVKSGTDAEYVKSLLDELKIMMYLRGPNDQIPNQNVINLIGACTATIYKLEPYIVLEFCELGSLQKLLTHQRKAFLNCVENGQIVKPEDFNHNYEKLPLNTLHLIKWSGDIANGMNYLANKKVIHGDLAARNVLVDKNLKVKISDFGLSRQLFQYSLYVKKEQKQACPLPWRWMALESLRDMTFSTESDVWSWGVTTWEIFSLGQVPFPGINWTSAFVTNLENGLRLEHPKYAPSKLNFIMSKCWKVGPSDRPSFVELHDELYIYLNSICANLGIEM